MNDLQISWIRHHDISLLTVGRYTYTSDQRFSAYHVPMTHFWQLRIRNVSHSDAGQYECQVSTTPPSGMILNLAVVGKLLLVTDTCLFNFNFARVRCRRCLFEVLLWTTWFFHFNRASAACWQYLLGSSLFINLTIIRELH